MGGVLAETVAPVNSVATAGDEGGADPVVTVAAAQEVAIAGTLKEEARAAQKRGRNANLAKQQAGLGVNYGVPPLRTQCFRKLGPCSVADRASGGKRGGPQKSEVEKGGKRAEGQKAMEGKQGGKSEKQQKRKQEKEETKESKATKGDEGPKETKKRSTCLTEYWKHVRR